jgi:hypothetical protein
MMRQRCPCLIRLSKGSCLYVQLITVSDMSSVGLIKLTLFLEQYLQSPMQLEHACTLILNSELFVFHSERMCEILVDDAQRVRAY